MDKDKHLYYSVILKAWIMCRKNKKENNKNHVPLVDLEVEFPRYSHYCFSYMQWAMTAGILHGTSCEKGTGFYLDDYLLDMNSLDFIKFLKDKINY